MTYSYEQLAQGCAEMALSREVWLRDHGPKRPPHEAERKREHLAMLRQLQAMCTKRAQQDRAA